MGFLTNDFTVGVFGKEKASQISQHLKHAEKKNGSAEPHKFKVKLILEAMICIFLKEHFPPT